MYVHMYVRAFARGLPLSWLAGFQLAGWPILLVGFLAGWIRVLLAGLTFLTFNFFNFFNVFLTFLTSGSLLFL